MSERLAKGVLSLSKLKWEVGADGRRQRKPGSSDAAPDYFGTMAAEVGRACGGDAIKLRLVGWARKSQKTGLPYIRVRRRGCPTWSSRWSMTGMRRGVWR